MKLISLLKNLYLYLVVFSFIYIAMNINPIYMNITANLQNTSSDVISNTSSTGSIDKKNIDIFLFDNSKLLHSSKENNIFF
jgi:hypothetical protein